MKKLSFGERLRVSVKNLILQCDGLRWNYMCRSMRGFRGDEVLILNGACKMRLWDGLTRYFWRFEVVTVEFFVSHDSHDVRCLPTASESHVLARCNCFSSVSCTFFY